MLKAKDLTTLSGESFRHFFESFDHVLCDCDGVITAYDHPLPGGKESIQALRKYGKRVGFVSNNTLRTTEEYHIKLNEMGFNPQDGDIVTPIVVAIDHLRREKFSKKIYCISCHGGKKDLKGAGFQVIDARQTIVREDTLSALVEVVEDVDPEVGAVYFDVDFTFNICSLQKAIRYLKQPDVVLFGSGIETRIPPIRTVTLLGPGYFHEIMKDCTGKEAITFGKPSRQMVEFVKNKVVDPARTIFIGDMLKQDMGFAKASGFKTLLVLSGVTTLSELNSCENEEYIPDYYIKDMDTFRSLIDKYCVL